MLGDGAVVMISIYVHKSGEEKERSSLPQNNLIKVALSVHLDHRIIIWLGNASARVKRIENQAVSTTSKHCSRA